MSEREWLEGGSERERLEGLGQSEWTPPTDAQLENFVRAILAGEARRLGVEIDVDVGARMVMATPVLKEAWLHRHRELQESVNAI